VKKEPITNIDTITTIPLINQKIYAHNTI